MNVSNALGNFWLSDWTSKTQYEELNQLNNKFRLLIYGLIGLFQCKKIFEFHFYIQEIELIYNTGAFSLFGQIMLAKMVTRSCKILHENMLSSILRAKLKFFETTPIGRILNRFSKDMHTVESVIPSTFENFVYCGLDALTSIIVIIITTPFFIVVLIPIGILYFFIQVFENYLFNRVFNKKIC